MEGVACPLCGKPVQENAKAFGCSDWKNGCRFTLWKDGLARSGGPQLNAKIVQLLLRDGRVKGSEADRVIAQEGAEAVYPPAWEDAEYRVLLTRENGQWKIKTLTEAKQ